MTDHAALGCRRRSESRTTRRRSSGSEVCGLDRPKRSARLPMGRGWVRASGSGSMSARRASACAAALMWSPHHARDSSAHIREKCSDEVPNVASWLSRKRERSSGSSRRRSVSTALRNVSGDASARSGSTSVRDCHARPVASALALSVTAATTRRAWSLPVRRSRRTSSVAYPPRKAARVGDALPEARRPRRGFPTTAAMNRRSRGTSSAGSGSSRTRGATSWKRVRSVGAMRGRRDPTHPPWTRPARLSPFAGAACPPSRTRPQDHPRRRRRCAR